MSTNLETYCDLLVEFPQEAWVVVLIIYKFDGGKALYPLYPLFTSTKMVCERTEAIKNEINDLEIEVGNELVVIPVKYLRTFELKREYWTKPTIKYSQSSRMDAFTKLLERPAFHELLVTPTELVGSSFTLTATLPVTVNDEAAIELFMKMSDFGVSKRAAHAAIYSIGEPFTLNWQTGEVKRAQERNVYPWIN